MKAWVVVKNGAPAQALALQEVGGAPPPVASGAQIVVRVSHATLNPADLHFMLHIPTWLPFRRRASPGVDFAGEVAALGPQAAACPAHAAAPLAVGDRVAGCLSAGLIATGHGALAEYVVVPADLVARQPGPPGPPGPSSADNKDRTAGPASSAPGSAAFAAGVLGCAGQTARLVVTDPAAEAAFRAAAAAGRPARVLVNGASGGVGSLLVQAAKARGAHVAAVCSAANAAFVRALGADEAIDYRAHDPLPAHLASAYGAGAGAAFDLIFDCMGDQALFSHSPAYLAAAGALVCIVGGPSQGVVPFVRNRLVPTFLGGTPRTYRLLALLPTGQQARDAAAWVADGTFRQMPVDSEYAFADVVQAYEKLATKHARGKIIIKVHE